MSQQYLEDSLQIEREKG